MPRSERPCLTAIDNRPLGRRQHIRMSRPSPTTSQPRRHGSESRRRISLPRPERARRVRLAGCWGRFPQLVDPRGLTRHRLTQRPGRTRCKDALTPMGYHFGMAYRFFSVPAVALAIAAFVGAQSAGQAPSSRPSPPTGPSTATARPDSPSAKPVSKSTWTPTRTPDGQPDLQGYWTNATFTPLERPAEFAGKEFFTPEEAAAYEKLRVDASSANPRTTSITTMRSGRPRLTGRACRAYGRR